MRRWAILAAVGSVLAGCGAEGTIGLERGTCFRMFAEGDAVPAFRELERVGNLESCAVLIEGLRMMEGRDAFGVYNGLYIFAEGGRITASKSLTDNRVRVFEAHHLAEVQAGLRRLIEIEAGRPS